MMLTRGLSQSDLARLAGVSRQAVSLWLREESPADMRVSHLLNLARALGVGAGDLVEPLPVLDPGDEGRAVAELLWDGLYPGLGEFCAAIARDEDRALARLVQVYGLYRAAGAAGGNVWASFPRYKRLIKPARRQGLERVWNLETGRA
ncbi:MAG: helix-turn-helix transcriptional regulator [Elusimicrobia bacterium]|nr:helix-turn-helix transcriptional regulator [Elusimicrobiota bacterium]